MRRMLMKNAMAITAVIIACALAFTALSLTGCEQLNDLSDVTLTGISAVYNGKSSIHLTRTVDELKDDLTVTAYYSDGSTKTLSKDEYTLSINDGALTVGTPVIIVSYGGRTATFLVTVTASITDITYNIVQTGGTDGAANSTGIVFTFSESIDKLNLTADDITVGGKAANDPAATLTGSGKTWTLAPITVIRAGQAAVQITKTGIDADIIHVTVYKEGEFAPVLTGITTVYNGAAINPAMPLDSFKTNLTVTAQYGDDSEEILSAHEYTLSVSGGTLTIGTATITVTYTHDGVTQTDEFTVTVECTDHDYQWEKIRAATETEDGAETGTCSICGTTTTHPLYATGTAGLNYELIDNNTAYRVNRGANSMYAFSELHIPAYWRPLNSTNYDDYKPVTHIGVSANSSNNNAFGGTKPDEGANTALTRLTFAENSPLTTISNYAFQYCTYLSGNITIPASVTSIGHYAFQGCARLTGVTIPASLTSVGMYAFSDCSSLASVTIAEGVTEIGDRMFYNCTSLTSVTIPASIRSVGTLAFENCTSLDSVTIAEGVTEIGPYMFKGCTSLESITIPASVTSTSYAFSGCRSLTSVTIADGVTSIGSRMFDGCTSLTSIDIPASVTKIGNEAFASCRNLTSVTLAAGVKEIGGNAFTGCTSLTTLTVDANNPHLTYDGGILYNKAKTKIILCLSVTGTITIPASVTEIGDSAFQNSTNLTSVVISDGVTSIGTSAFAGCTRLTSITIPESVTSIGSMAFDDCISLNNVTIPRGVTKISSGMFWDCRSLTSITIPDGVTEIGHRAFEGCANLASVNIPDGVTEIGQAAFENCSKLTSIDIPGSVTKIWSYAFTGCTGLTSVTIAEGVKEIERYAFWDCTKLTSIDIPEGVTSIGEYAFRGCTGLISITIPASVTKIDSYAFSGCSGLTTATIAAASLGPGNYLFFNCNKLATVTIAASVKAISDWAFYSCGDLRAKFYATDSVNGTPGTYTANANKVWTLQP